MILINEWLPNPSGNDANGEWIELKNTSAEPQSLAGWSLATQEGKNKLIAGEHNIAPGGFVALSHEETKISLRNSDGNIFLYDSFGHLVDKATFLGTAQEGKSVSRFGDIFFFTDPTPGKENAHPEASEVATIAYVPGTQFVHTMNFWGVFEYAFFSGLALAALFMFMLKKHNGL